MIKTKEEINEMYLGLANTLEADYFKIVLERDANDKVLGQHRELRSGKSLDTFNQSHSEIWRNHEDELVSSGYLAPRIEVAPVPSLEDRIKELEAKVAKLEGVKS